MNSPLQRIQSWRSFRKQHREQRSLEWWEQAREEGRARFVRRTALTYGLSVAGITDIVQRALYGEADSLLLNIIFFVLAGVVIGFCTWSAMEAKREDALRKARAKALPDNQTLPQSGKGVSKT